MRAQKLSEDYVVSGMAARCLMYHGALPETETNIFLIAYYLAHPVASCMETWVLIPQLKDLGKE